MKTDCWWAILLLLATSSVSGQQAELQDSNADSELLQLEQVWNQAHLTADAVALDSLWSDQMTINVSGMPEMGKAAALEFLRSGRMKFEKYETTNICTHRYGNTAVVTGRLMRERKLGDKVVKDDWRFTKVYLRKGRSWEVIAWHASPAPIE